MMVAGLLTMCLARGVVYPAATLLPFPLFLAALIILAAGITILQVSANPYVALLGTGQDRFQPFDLTQAFNSFGTFIVPLFGGILILDALPLQPWPKSRMNPASHAYRVEQALSVKLSYIMIVVALRCRSRDWQVQPSSHSGS